jgi:predicted aspartyl protease
MRKGDLPCAEETMAGYVKLRPTDGKAIANLGFILSQEDKDEEAVVQFKQAIGLGEGAYDLFGAYAGSLAKLGRNGDAIDWSYKTLKLVPSLVDVRGKLAQLLVLEKRPYEALAVLAEFDEFLEKNGRDDYFTAQRKAIESTLKDTPQPAAEVDQLRLAKLDNQFYAPVSVGESGTRAFLVDTGATSVVLSDEFLVASKAKYTLVRTNARATLADGRVIDAKQVIIDHIHVGAFELDNVKAMACGSCELLLGQTALSQFDLHTTQVNGVDVLSLSRSQNSRTAVDTRISASN